MSASFHEVLLSPAYSGGAKGGAGFLTTVLILSGGDSQRNINWARALARYDITEGLKGSSDIRGFVNFFFARRGRAYGFRHHDWADYQLPFPAIMPGPLLSTDVDGPFVTDGTTGTFQLTKGYGDAGNSYQRPITKPKDSSVTIVPAFGAVTHEVDTTKLWNNGVAMVRGTDFTLDPATGIITLSNAIKATTGRNITFQCEFDVPVRFDTDDMETVIQEFDIMSWSQILLVEVRDI
jgi:uncharacterized protein (TIGR02217 family)